MPMEEEKKRHTVWLNNRAWKKVGLHYRQDNCTTQNEFIEKAILFYCGYLDAEDDMAFLPRVLSTVLEGSLNTLAKRTGRMHFKQQVETCMIMHILSADTDMDLKRIDRLRVRSIQDVLTTNGEITFGDILRFQKGL